jgi:hypothetical protein
MTKREDEDKEILQEALDRWHLCEQAYGTWVDRFRDDLRFDAADDLNCYQWPNDIRKDRALRRQPTLTVNKIAQHNFQILNDIKQNTPAVVVKAAQGDASYSAAQIYMDLCRHIQYASRAEDAYNVAAGFQVRGGKGYIQVGTKYVDDDSFDQELCIWQIEDPLMVYGDPNAKELDKSDSKYYFVFQDIPRKEAEKDDPDVKHWAPGSGPIPATPMFTARSWVRSDYIRKAVYWRIHTEHDTLYQVVLGEMVSPGVADGEIFRGEDLPAKLRREFDKNPYVRKRKVARKQVQWFTIFGNKITSRGTWVGSTIPIVPALGTEYKIDGVFDWKGHTRNMRDAQRMYNYYTSSGAEHVALQTKTPYKAPLKAIEGLEGYWNNANTVNFSVLPYNHKDDEGEEIPPPAREQPPQMGPAYVQGMQIATAEIMSATGQFEQQFGQAGNERTGAAIQGRKLQGDKATFHFKYNLGVAIRRVGMILVECIPKIYDTARVVTILGLDGNTQEVYLDPSAKQAATEGQPPGMEKAMLIFNPNVGKYAVEADVGPGYATRREQAFDALALILTQSKELTPIIGDLLIRNGDFPLADEAAERLKRMVPKQALGQGPSQEEQAMQAQVQNLTAVLSEALEELAKKELQLVGKDSKRDIDGYKALTERLKVIIDAQGGQDEMRLAVAQLYADIIANPDPGQPEDSTAGGGKATTLAAAESALGNSPMPGARRGPDGMWYVKQADGSWAMLVRKGGEAANGGQ